MESASLGSSTRAVSRVRDREVEYIEGFSDSRKARGDSREASDAAGKKKISTGDVVIQSKRTILTHPDDLNGSKSAGKSSGTRSIRGGGVAAAVGNAVWLPERSPSDDAYERALTQGREMLKHSYTRQSAEAAAEKTRLAGSPNRLMPTKSRTASIEYKPGGDRAGNFRKEAAPRASKARPETLTSTPFGVDPVTSSSTADRFKTSASNIGSRAMTLCAGAPTSQPSGKAAPGSTAMVLAAGMRPGIGPGS